MGWGIPVAWAVLLLWWGVLAWTKPQPVVDEVIHTPAVLALATGDFAPVRELPMLPGYHLLAAGIVRLGGDWAALRGVNVFFVGLGACCLYAAACRRGDEDPDATVLLQVLNPAGFWLFALVYTEPLSWLLLAIAVWLHTLRRPGLTAAVLVLSVLVRQSNVVWLVLFAVWSWLNAYPATAPPARRLLRRGRVLSAYGVAVIVAGLILLLNVGWVMLPNPNNRAGLNPATLFLCGFIAALVWVPLWLPDLFRNWRTVYGPALRRASVCGMLLAGGITLFLVYRNPHHWNSNPNYLHDAFAETLLRIPVARAAVIMVLLAAMVPLVRFAQQIRHAAQLLPAWIFVLLFVAPHFLADHRYAILPVLILHAAARYTRYEARVLCVWSGLLTLGAAAYFVRFGAERAGL
ncbi:MAG: hypothetical protein IPM18_07795 [Phycisphaerales bacterium]|nr:hypothetical protein [Phycisphaerales bacterium]